NHFYGHIRFSYTPPNGKLNEKESALFKQYGVVPCDYEKTLELHKFELNLRGTVQAEEVATLPTIRVMAESELREEVGFVPFQEDKKVRQALQ
ncbi:hypothetical protein GKC32_09640, partial [Lactobacillus curvatus]|nr:hypothetical protein [Latilactobacillus curvatus]